MRMHGILRRVAGALKLPGLAMLVALQPATGAAQTEAPARPEVRVLETVDPASGRRSLHVMEGLSPDEIRAVQRALSGAGFGGSWMEGSLDPFTRGALQRFQTHRGLAVCACVSLETLIELGLRVRVAETIVLEEPRRSEAEDAGHEAGAGGAGPREGASTFVDYGRYYPYGVVLLAPYLYPYHDPYHDPVHGPGLAGPGVLAGRAGPGFAVGARLGGVHVGAAVGPVPALGRSPAMRPLGPFPRVTPPPNVVRGGG